MESEHKTEEGAAEQLETEPDKQKEEDVSEATQLEQSDSQDTYCSEPSILQLNRSFLVENSSSGNMSQATTADVADLESGSMEEAAVSSGPDYDEFKENKLKQTSSSMSDLSAKKRKINNPDSLATAHKRPCVQESSPIKNVTEHIQGKELPLTGAASRKLFQSSSESSPELKKPRHSVEVVYMSEQPVDVVDLVDDSQQDSSEDLCLHLSPSPTPRTQEVVSYSSYKSSEQTTGSVELLGKRRSDAEAEEQQNKKLKSSDQQPLSESSEEVLTPIIEEATQLYEMTFLLEVRVQFKCAQQDNQVVQRRITQCEDVTQKLLHEVTKKLSDCSSSGHLADCSSKNTSPSSSTGGPVPFALQPTRMSLMSLLSGSSSSSGGTSAAQQVFRTKHVTAGQFAMPDVPKKPSPDRQVDGLELVSKVVSNLLPERGEERSKTPEAKEITPKGRMSPLKTSTAKRKPLFSKRTVEALGEEVVLKPRQQVFARWTDRKYYSGRVKELNKDGRWVIDFDDGNSKALVAEFVIPVKDLKKGQSVYALAEDEEYLSGVIIKVEKKRGDTVYCVELDEGQKVNVLRSSIFMTEDQAKTLKEEIAVASPMKTTPQRITDVSLDNVLEGKRSRTRSKEAETPGVSGITKSKKKGASLVSSESELGSAVDCVDGVEPETAGRDIRTSRVKGLGRGTAKKNESGSEFGPVPELGSNIFSGKCFLLTNSDMKLERSMSEDTATENTDYDEPVAQFSKSYLTKQIQAGGGEVFARFEDVPPSKHKSCYLVANKPNQTALYILCIAHGIPVVANTWIIQSCKENACVPVSSHVLPVGYSLEKRDFVNRAKAQPLQRVKIGLVSDVKFFVKFWKKVLEAAGATVAVIPPQKTVKEMKDLQVFVSNQCPFEVHKQIEELGKPLVTTKWVVQCLVNGCRLSITGHQDYMYQSQSDE